jgi:hypothetical protein
VLANPRVIGDKTYLTFGVILTSRQFQEDARAFVIQNDPELRIPGGNVDVNAIRVDGWPIITLTVKVIEPVTNEILGTWISAPLQAAGPTISIPIGFDAQSLKLFQELSPSGDIQFAFSYTFQNVRQQYAASLTQASREINQVLQNTVQSLNKSPGDPIFESQMNAFRSTLAAKFVTDISASSAELIPLVQSQLVDHYFTTQTVDIKNLQDSKLQDAIYGYLKPLLQTAAQKTTDEYKSGLTQENTDNVKLGAGVKVSGVGVNFGVDNTERDNVSQTTGTTFEWSTTDQAYEPHDIRVYKLSTITDEDTVEIVNRAFIVQGGDPSFQDDTPVRSDFTDTRINIGGNGGERFNNFDGILPGMAFCFFGKDVPSGYQAVEPDNRWADAAWMPDGLRGQPMPESQDMLIGATNQVAQIGTIWNSGNIALGALSVPSQGLMIGPHSGSPNFAPAAPGYGARAINKPGNLIIPFVNSDDLDFVFSMNTPSFTNNNPNGIYPMEIIPHFNHNSQPNIGSAYSLMLPLTFHMTPLASEVYGNATVQVPTVPLNGIEKMPQHLRCRIIVKE